MEITPGSLTNRLLYVIVSSMENKQNTFAAVLGGIVILLLLIGASFFVGQKIRENFFKPKPTVVTSVIEKTQPLSLLTDQKDQKATVSGKYKTIPSTGPESLVLLLLPAMGAAGIYLKSKSAY